MKSNFSYKTDELDVTYDDVEEEIRNRIEVGYDFTLDSYKVSLNWDTEESTVYVEYTKVPGRRLIGVGSLNMSYKLYKELEKDKSDRGFNETIINALENYYEV